MARSAAALLLKSNVCLVLSSTTARAPISWCGGDGHICQLNCGNFCAATASKYVPGCSHQVELRQALAITCISHARWSPNSSRVRYWRQPPKIFLRRPLSAPCRSGNCLYHLKLRYKVFLRKYCGKVSNIYQRCQASAKLDFVHRQSPYQPSTDCGNSRLDVLDGLVTTPSRLPTIDGPRTVQILVWGR